jgi:hypothetical protein
MLQSVKYNGDVIAHNSRVGLDGGTVESLENLNDFSEVTRSINQPLLLDYVPNAAAAYSVRKLRSAYTGSAIRVRRAFDNTEQDIGFDANGNLNTTALTNFVNGESTLPADYGSGAVAAYSLRYVSSTYSGPVVRVRRSSDNTEQNFTPTEITDGTLTSFVGSENLVTNSESLSDVILVGTTRTENNLLAPDGTTTGDTIFETVTNDIHILFHDYTSAVIGQNFTYSVYVKSVGGRNISVFSSSGFAGGRITIDPNGNILSLTGIGSVETSVDGWYRVSISGSATTSTLRILIYSIEGGNNTFAGDVTKGVSVWGRQLYSGLSVLPYNRTTTGIGGEGYVTTWYDQRGGNNAVQSTAANQPKIVDKGALILDNGKPTIKFDGVNDNLINANTLNMVSVFTVFNILSLATNNPYIVSQPYNTNPIKVLGFIGTSNINLYRVFSGINLLDDSTATLNKQEFLYGLFNSTNSEIKLSNGALITGDSGNGINTSGLIIGAAGNVGTSTFLNGNIQEIVIFSSNESSNRANIEFGINNFYNIYSVSKDGFVTTWYDQSGSNNNAVQPTASSQPQIVSSGNTIFENGRVAVKFDGVDDEIFSTSISGSSTQTTFFVMNYRNDVDAMSMYDLYSNNSSRYSYYVASSVSPATGVYGTPSLYVNGTLTPVTTRLQAYNALSNNKGQILRADVNANTSAWVDIGFGFWFASYAYSGTLQEWIIYQSNQTSKRKLLESEINKYYNIYRPTANVSVYNKQPYTTDDMSQFMSNISTNFNYDQSLDVNTFGNLSGTLKWIGGVLAPNGKIYGIPYNSTTILEINPLTKTTTTFGNLTTPAGWVGGVLAPNGKIYGIPFNSTSVLEIDPIKRTTTTFGNLTGTNKWGGGVLAPNGKIYGIPNNSTTVLEIDPNTKTTTTFGDIIGTGKYYGGVLGANGKIYCIPFNATSILEIDPVTKTTITFGSVTGSTNWYGGVLAPNGKIYGIPNNSTTVLEINPITQTIATFGNLTGTGKWVGGVLAPNGKIYGIPSNSTTVLEIDPRINATTTFGDLTGSVKWYGGVLGTNGEIYGIPLNSTTVLEILSPVTGLDNNIPLSRFLNKF